MLTHNLWIVLQIKNRQLPHFDHISES